jgi:outer membrane receptor protein involved in Fe transport
MRFGAVAKIIEGLYLKALYGTSYVPPAPSQLGAVPLQLSGGVEGNPDLNSQSAQTPEGAIIFHYWKPLKLQLSVFYTKIENRVEFVQNGLVLTADNLTDSTSIGGTLSANFNWRFLFAKGDVALVKTKIEDPDLPSFTWTTVYADDIEGGRKSPNFPSILSHFNLGVRFPEYHFQVALIGAYVGERKSSYTNIVENRESYLLDSYMTLGAHIKSVDLRFFGNRETTFSLHGNNLTNTQYAHGGALGVDIPALGISAFLKISQEI